MIRFVITLAFAILGASGLSGASITFAASTVPAGAANIQHATTGEVPAVVKEAVKETLPNAQSLTPQHRDLTDAQVAGIEKESGMKLDSKDHDSYLAFAGVAGTRKQIGMVTIVKAQGREIVIVYSSEKASVVIIDAHGESGGVPHGFLDQFKGKRREHKLRLGHDIKPQDVDEALARAITDAIRLDVVTIQTLYGAAHAH